MTLAYKIVGKIYCRCYNAIGFWIEDVEPEGNPHRNNPLNSASGMLTELQYSFNLIFQSSYMLYYIAMRKFLPILLMLLIPAMLSAGSLEMFHMDHPVYSEMDALYTIEGQASPFGARPWTEMDIMRLLSTSRDDIIMEACLITPYIKRNSSYIIK